LCRNEPVLVVVRTRGIMARRTRHETPQRQPDQARQ
jgi:hypothetical protein